MNLKELKSRYDGKCAKCGREIRKDWNIFYDADTKKVYCKPCGAELQKGGNGPEQTGFVTIVSGYTGLCARCQKIMDGTESAIYSQESQEIFCSECGAILTSSDSKETVLLRLAVNEILVNLDELIAQARAHTDMLGAMSTQMEVVMADIRQLLDKEVKPKKETVKVES